jgi:ADP-ribose pyrophosphatase
MLKFTICFIKQGDHILLLNREKPSWMGAWNGVGGKLEPNETPRESILREVKEETGIVLDSIDFKGVVTWFVGGTWTGGMYAYIVELPSDYRYETPRKTDEGILDWKDMQWILHPENRGIVTNIPKFIGKLIHDPRCFEHRCFYQDGQLVQYECMQIDEDIENVTDKFKLEHFLQVHASFPS